MVSGPEAPRGLPLQQCTHAYTQIHTQPIPRNSFEALFSGKCLYTCSPKRRLACPTCNISITARSLLLVREARQKRALTTGKQMFPQVSQRESTTGMALRRAPPDPAPCSTPHNLLNTTGSDPRPQRRELRSSIQS